eukprot:5496492-Amphidinium_carterae.1
MIRFADSRLFCMFQKEYLFTGCFQHTGESFGAIVLRSLVRFPKGGQILCLLFSVAFGEDDTIDDDEEDEEDDDDYDSTDSSGCEGENGGGDMEDQGVQSTRIRMGALPMGMKRTSSKTTRQLEGRHLKLDALLASNA